MGMFDRIWIECPECKEMVEFQSKAGGCALDDYYIRGGQPTAIPRAILDDIMLDSHQCEKCGHIVRLKPPEEIVSIY